MPYYKIGDIGRKFGVTPDFLKYYEKRGILHPQLEPNGYRSYSFSDGRRILECIQLRNCGFSGTETADIVTGDTYADFLRRMDAYAENTRREMLFRQGVMSVIRELHKLEDMLGRPEPWEVVEQEGMYFFPYSLEDDLIHNPGPNNLVALWSSYLPVVQNGIFHTTNHPQPGRIDKKGKPSLAGLSVPESFARDMGLLPEGELPPQLTYIPLQRTLLIYGRSVNLNRKSRNEEERSHNPIVKANRILERHSFTVTGDCLSRCPISLMENGICYSYHIIQIPIE